MTLKALCARTVVTAPHQPQLDDHGIVIDGSRIVEIAPNRVLEGRSDLEIMDLKDHLLMPGLVNAHTHLAMNQLRGIANDLPLMTWLNEHIWPAENRWLSDEFVADGMRLAFIESLRAGVTQFNDMYLFPETGVRVAEEVGIRASIGLFMIDFPTAYGAGPDDYYQKADALIEQAKDHPLVQLTWGPHAPYTVSEQHLIKLRDYRDRYGMKIHMHVHETKDETEGYIKQHGKRPLQHLKELGLLSDHLIAVHMTQLTDEEIQWIADAKVNVGHCPESNLKLASGFCPTHKLLEAGVNVAVGTDGVASNNDLCMLSEMRIASFLAKANASDPRIFNADQTFASGTINGAVALGSDQQTGTLEVGKQADIVALHLENPESAPIFQAVDHIAYSADRQHVNHVWVAGKQLLKDRQTTTLNQDDVMARIEQWRQKIIESRK
ncbi:MAG: TRZ/ATZ family hydrolase [Gammaproteobacteria bacterium]|nr:TRZ/ATZ family hydrolase [Gammaproteobacteria bacterium]